jgi:hypothetical protein
MCPIGVSGFGTDAWNAAFYAAMAAVAKAAEKVQEKSKSLSLPARLWKLDRDLRSFVGGLYKPVSEISPGTSSPEAQREAADKLYQLHRSIEDMYSKMQRAGRTNQTLTGGSLRSIRKQGLDLEEIAESIHLSLDPKIHQLFDEARRERETDDTVTMESLF